MPDPIQTAILTPGGLHPTPYQATSLKEAQSHEPDGVYTITRTYAGNQALLLDAHLDRLEESAQLEQIPLLLDRLALRRALRTLIERAGYPESRFRITVPRATPAHLYLALEPLVTVPLQVKQAGVITVTAQAHRHNPIAKTTAWMAERQAITQGVPSSVYEVILVDAEGNILEGSSSNIYGVLNGRLHTADSGILKGISRRVLLEVAPTVLPILLTPIHQNDVPQLSEAFLTSSSRGVVPIVAIDGIPIGDGTPQPLTRELSQRYDDWTNAHLTPI